MKNFVFGFAVLSILAIANDSFAGCRSCGRSGVRANKGSCSAPKAASAPAVAPKAASAAPAAPAAKAASVCANGSCGSASGLRGKLRLR